jgi:large subunit ribosomal protein L29
MSKESRLKPKELREQEIGELQKRAGEIEENIFNLKVRLKAATLDSTADIGKARHNLARVKTVIREKELAAEKSAQSSAKQAQQAPAAGK